VDDPELLLIAERLAVAYGRRIVLRDVDLRIRRGEFWFFLGPNGQGKTSLLRCLLGTLKPQAGRLLRSPSLLGFRNIGFVPQRCDLNPTLPTTVREFVSMGLVGTECPRGERRGRLNEALDRVGLSGKVTDDYWSLSGGQRQRALVARALIRRPRLLILDEPTNGLDLPAEESLLEFLAALNRQERLTMLFVTHDLAIAARFGSHFALFHDTTVTAGVGEDVLSEQTLQKTYGLNVVIGRDPAGTATVRLGAGTGTR